MQWLSGADGDPRGQPAENGNRRPTAIRNCVLSLNEPGVRFFSQSLQIGVLVCETQLSPQTSALPSCELKTGCCFQASSLWEFIKQQQEMNALSHMLVFEVIHRGL